MSSEQPIKTQPGFYQATYGPREYSYNNNTGSIPYDISPLLSIFRLNAQNKELIREAEHWKKLALTDELTELPNRLALKLHMQEQAESHEDHHRTGKKDVSIIFIDLDDFGPINKIHGNENGDRALQVVAKAMDQTIREDDRLFRKAGDEFVALLYGADINDANSTVARRMESLLEKGIDVELSNGATIKVHGTIGVFEYDHSRSLTENVAEADIQMRIAKQQNKLERARRQAELDGPPAPAAASTPTPRQP